MSESLLKKEFKERDVNRVRNLINKNYNEGTRVGSGYTRSYKRRREGEVWEEDGKTWVIRNGIQEVKEDLQEVRDLTKIPLFCPSCENTMTGQVNKKMYKIHGKCLNCVVEYESLLRQTGKYKEYERAIMTGNLQSFTKDLEYFVRESLKEIPEFFTENGDKEVWKGSSGEYTKEILKKLDNYIKQVNLNL